MALGPGAVSPPGTARSLGLSCELLVPVGVQLVEDQLPSVSAWRSACAEVSQKNGGKDLVLFLWVCMGLEWGHPVQGGVVSP